MNLNLKPQPPRTRRPGSRSAPGPAGVSEPGWLRLPPLGREPDQDAAAAASLTEAPDSASRSCHGFRFGVLDHVTVTVTRDWSVIVAAVIVPASVSKPDSVSCCRRAAA